MHMNDHQVYLQLAVGKDSNPMMHLIRF